MDKTEFDLFLTETRRRMPALSSKLDAVPAETQRHWFHSVFEALAVGDAVDALDDLFAQGGLGQYSTVDAFPGAIQVAARRRVYEREGKQEELEVKELKRAIKLKGEGVVIDDPCSQSCFLRVESRMQEWKKLNGEDYTPQHLISKWTEEEFAKLEALKATE